jgi:hypothetical protein
MAPATLAAGAAPPGLHARPPSTPTAGAQPAPAGAPRTTSVELELPRTLGELRGERQRIFPLFAPMRTVGPTLPGALAGLSLRLGLEEQRSPLLPRNPFCERSGNGCMVARIAYGLFVGKFPQPRGQISLYLGPRAGRGLVSGVKTRGAPSGMALRGTLFFAKEWGVNLELRAVRGLFAGVGLVWRP